ncbi:Rrf2 family transcriptional regulator [Candidatus Sumerlaeota bacterium]|nr:Rrf2 family transcriptional regulator [Candidatus Sumerlaeota bacterium]
MISQTAEYALRAIVYISQNPDVAQTAQQIAGKTHVPKGYLSKIMQSMARSGLVVSQRGLGGGFTLARPAKEISVLDVLSAADAPIQRIQRCPLGIKSHAGLCPVHRLVDDAIKQIEDAFRQANIEDLVNSTNGVKPLCEE